MTLRLSVNEAKWAEHVQSVARDHPGLVPVVKGNGYGFRRWTLMPLAARLGSEVCVGSVYEVKDAPDSVTPIVLTPTLSAPPSTMPARTVLTVGSIEHVIALASHGWTGSVMVKLRSAVHRYGADEVGLDALLDAVRDARMTVHGWSIHPALAGETKDHVADVERWLERIGTVHPVYVSHLDQRGYAYIRSRHPGHDFRIRMGTALWHGDKSTMQLSTDVLDHHPLEAGERAGYRQVPVTGAGSILVVGAGTSHGVRPLDDGRSPFHYQQQRLNLLEPPHMHSSMLFVARGRQVPAVGEWLDVQCPLTRVQVDVLQWVR
jgi:alanine racemase